MHVDLLNGESAELRDAETFTRKERSALYAEIVAAHETEDDPEKATALGTLVIFKRLVESWTLDRPLPNGDVAVLDDLLAMDFTAIDWAANAIMQKLSPVQRFTESLDPQSPTKPSSESSSSGRATRSSKAKNSPSS